jgi:hypothetical protein
MKTRFSFLALVLLATAAIPAHAAKKPKFSKLSAYAGSCPGSCLFSSSGFTYTGNTQGSFVAARRQEVGTLTLNSVITNGSSSAGLLESYQFRNRSFFYTISVAGSSSGAGSGTASITPHVISYSATFTISSLTYNLTGTIRQTKNRIFVNEVLSASGSSSATISYTLRRPKHRS